MVFIINGLTWVCCFLSSSLYLNLVLGNVNVTLLSNQAKWVSASMHIRLGLAVGVCWSPETGMVFYYIWLVFGLACGLYLVWKKWSYISVKHLCAPTDTWHFMLCAFCVPGSPTKMSMRSSNFISQLSCYLVPWPADLFFTTGKAAFF